jgi:hypothetical protein
MVEFAPARADCPTPTDEGAWACALVQQQVDDVVLGAARCRPNAGGRFEFSSFRGFGERQLLKARGAYVGPDVVVGVTPLEVCLVELTFFGCQDSFLLLALLLGYRGVAADGGRRERRT